VAAFLDPVEQSGERLRLLAECDERKVLGSDVDIEIDACDECNTVVNVKRITRETQKAGGGFVGHDARIASPRRRVRLLGSPTLTLSLSSVCPRSANHYGMASNLKA
jgi:hypothetical protein